MTRTACIYARIQSQKTSSSRHIKYLLDGHGTDKPEALFWTKGIPKAKATADGLPSVWAAIDRQWRREKASGGTVAAHSRVTYMQSLITMPNDITASERHSLAKQILRMFGQKHPVTIVAHDLGTSGLPNKHLHVAYSYRRFGYGPVDRELQQGFEKNLKALLERQYRKYGFKIVKNMESLQVKHKPQPLMRVLLKKHGRERMRNPTYLTRVVLPQLKAEVEKCRRVYAEEVSDTNAVYLRAAESSVAWLIKEIHKAQCLKQTPRVPNRPHTSAGSPFDDLYRSLTRIAPRRQIR
ncbi:hypothetical protein [Desulfopila aestuarii]|uniref:Relaxase/Mobilisation nuclease domain-containing protein n=1 Tax=Desulfopila aestuarii DSM 18488 TaxID=1121416 RepID=A0A1M7YGI4_9BACT|nr:hypothetical protein [Desulfopila aestuarii]SHO51757.1 hypothetical protein SAMN02745220_04212 [Desulfopila aestuarii DSM 18488]